MSELIVVTCPYCQKQLKAPSDRIGRAAKCPQCQQSFALGEGTAAGASASGIAMAAPVSGIGKATPPAPPAPPINKPAAMPAAAPAAAPKWTLKIPTGDTYGPIERAELDHWFQEGRINAECQLLAEGEPRWRWASEVYPSLNGSAAAPPHSPYAPAAAPQIGAAVSAGVAKGWNAIGGFMDNVVGQGGHAAAAEPQVVLTGPLEPKWYTVVAGLNVTKWSLLLGALLCTLFSTFLLLGWLTTGGFQRGMGYLLTYCSDLSVAAYIAYIVGVLLQLAQPPRKPSRNLILLTILMFFTAFGLMSILHIFNYSSLNFSLFGLTAPRFGNSGFEWFIINTVTYIQPLIFVLGLCVFGCYLHATNLLFGRRELRSLVMISFGLLAGSYLCFFINTFISNINASFFIGLVQMLLLAACLGQLGLMSHHLKQVIQAQQPQP